jgi:DNA-binding response OmpR family regulator
MRVLVAEDKPRLANLLRRALMREGYEVALAMDGEQDFSQLDACTSAAICIMG